MPLQSPEEQRQRERWGWIAVLHLESGGKWIGAKDAARLSGIRSSNLRRWADRGVISVIRDPGHQRHYYIPELELLAFWGKAKGEPLNVITLTNHIAVILAPAYDCESAEPPWTNP